MSEKVDEWVVLELSTRSEGEDPELIRQAICRSLPGADVFIPAVVTEIGSDRTIHYLVDGYAFIRHQHPVGSYVRLENTRYVQSVLSEPGSIGKARRVSTIRTADIERMQGQVEKEVHQGIGIGDRVRITTGVYRNIEATVIEEIPEEQTVQVYVQLRSKQSIVTIPRSGLVVIDRAPLSPVLSRLTALRAWLRQASPILYWRPKANPEALQALYQRYERVSGWLSRGHRLYAFVTFLGTSSFEDRLGDIQGRLEDLEVLDAWLVRGNQLHTFVAGYYQDPHQARLQTIQGKLMELAWLDDVMRRVKALRRSVDTIAHKAAKRLKNGDEKVIQNVLVDGHNLAFRCLYAPGMSDLSDSQGRPTGVVLGFLRSLGALRKRFPEARLYVAWDGRAQRRKKLFPDYKANRPTRASEGGEPVFDQVGFLVKILPFLGVRQLTNPEEEADDILAAMVRGKLKDQHNLIFSSDRDLLQLVSETTVQLVPGTGSRKEILFDEAEVLKSFEVRPEKLVQLRAFFGDSSDNIPGVPRVPKKVLRSLVQAHGSIDGVYSSGLTGLSKGQYERLRLAEPQVRINLTLMSLVDVPVSVTDPDVDAKAAAAMLQGIEVNPKPILEALFGPQEVQTETADA